MPNVSIEINPIQAVIELMMLVMTLRAQSLSQQPATVSYKKNLPMNELTLLNTMQLRGLDVARR